MTSYYNVGKIVNTHGIKGEVKVVRITDFDERFKPGNRLYLFLADKPEPLALTIKQHRKHKQFDMLQFEGYHNINEVEHFKQGILKIDHHDYADLEDGSYYYDQIIGCDVETTTGDQLGIIKEILAPGANDVWVVKSKGSKDILVPYIEQVVKEVHPEEKRVIIELMDGMLP
ncbi:16S rRNA processing protein RimM [Amphibacillus marinus]|uniref:Ribosome maturation factor RimM n=1 Tax=Amphibacillus marinus TaxID=872970 RepID=A0A1H8HVF3_9BACI|nr:ribosome maturation factor RimM [Amphibacillus marinus]SEN59955.1 16S rRNA processing protein RimM [Amphibacillus marinus]